MSKTDLKKPVTASLEY